jgi:hypothetical protein
MTKKEQAKKIPKETILEYLARFSFSKKELEKLQISEIIKILSEIPARQA